MNMKQHFVPVVKRLVPEAASLAFQVVGSVVSIAWGFVMFFSIFIAAGVGIVFAQDRIIPALGLGAGFLSSLLTGTLAIASAFVAAIVLIAIEFIVLLIVLLVIAGLIAGAVAVVERVRHAFARS